MKPTVPEVLPIVRALYARHSAGCCWHVVLDDGNVGRETVNWCAEEMRRDGGCQDRPNGGECERLAELLPLMSPTQIRKLGRLA